MVSALPEHMLCSHLVNVLCSKAILSSPICCVIRPHECMCAMCQQLSDALGVRLWVAPRTEAKHSLIKAVLAAGNLG